MNTENLKAIGGLIAVVVGIVAVVILASVTITRLGAEDKDSMVAITTSAFGIISAVVGAYLGIKISAETNAKAGEEGKKAAVAEHEANVKEQKIAAVNETVEKLVSEEKVSPEQANEIQAASTEAEEAARTAVPPRGGGAR